MSKRPPERLSGQPNPKRASVGYLNGAPGQVGSFGTHPRGPNGPPPIGRTISVQSRGNQIHQQTNNTGSVPILAQPGSNNDKECLPGEIMFVSREYKSRGVHAKDDIMCLRELNKKLEDSQLDEYKKWAYLGVVRQLAMPTARQRNGKLDTQLYNVDVYGRTNVRNVFKTHGITNGDHLQLVAVGGIKYDRDGNVRHYDQLLPAINDEIVRLEEMRDPVTKHVIPIGIVSNAMSAQTRGAQTTTPPSNKSVEDAKQQMMLEMLIV